jgi:flagellar motility protein MotE (MotC chaperone)
MDERYSIEVNDEIVEIYGDLTVEEAFDFLSFFERKGYKSVVLGSENSTLRMMKRDQTEVIINEKISDLKDELEMYRDHLKQEEILHCQTKEKLQDIERLLKSLMSEEYEKYKKLKEENDKLIRAQTHLFLHEDPEVQRILKEGGFIGCSAPGTEL